MKVNHFVMLSLLVIGTRLGCHGSQENQMALIVILNYVRNSFLNSLYSRLVANKAPLSEYNKIFQDQLARVL